MATNPEMAEAANKSSTNPSGIGGKIHFNISVNLTADEVKDWTPERVKAWFDGVAQIVRSAEGVGLSL